MLFLLKDPLDSNFLCTTLNYLKNATNTSKDVCKPQGIQKFFQKSNAKNVIEKYKLTNTNYN